MKVIHFQPIHEENSVSYNDTLHVADLVMVFDVETNGLLNLKRGFPCLHDCPYILQLSYVLYDMNKGCIAKTVDSYVNIPEQIPISQEITKINGITKEMCRQGSSIVSVLTQFYNDFHKCGTIIAHNYQFDSNMINIEFQRNWEYFRNIYPYALNLFQPVYLKERRMRFKCTMVENVEICKLPQVNARFPPKEGQKPSYKWPTLVELHKYIFKSEPKCIMHNSMMDVLVTLRCYIQLEKNASFTEEEFQEIVEKTK
jgi:DNA polymerase III epsilon subunit-like protein